MNIIESYAEKATAIIHRIHPELNKDDIMKEVLTALKEHKRDPSIHMDNNVNGNTADITLTKLCGWIKNENPIISGNGTFYCQPEELVSPTSKMLKDLKKGRKRVKNQMFQYKPGSDMYQMLDLDQQNKKVIMNAEYGGSGTPTAAFYNKYSPAATTLMAQSIITTMAAFFEGYIGNNHKFFHINECFDWMDNVLEKKTKDIHKWIKIPTRKEVFDEITKHFMSLYPGDLRLIEAYINSVTEKQLVYLYYTNNFKALLSNHQEVKDILFDVLNKLPNYEAAEEEVPDSFKDRFNKPDEDNLNAYNKWMSKEMFLNPYEIPDVIKDDMEKFIKIMNQYVFVEYLTPDSIVKLNNHKRNTVLLVDTDSNMLNANLFVSHVLDELFPGETFGRKRMYNDMILVNVLAACLSEGIAKILMFYCKCHNITENAEELTMKNEFMFRKFFLMQTKKRYAASIVLREGNIIVPFKPEIKGMDFIKAGVTEDVSKRFEKMLCDHVLFSNDMELHELMQDLKIFEKEIYNDLKSGGTRFLKQQQFKSEKGYKNIQKAWSLPVFKGSMVWNELFKETKIYSLDRVHILKLSVSGISDLEKIKNDFPNEYNEAVSKIFLSSKPEIVKAGMKYICIPTTVKKIPDWIIPLIDIDLIISDTISVFRSVLNALGIEEMGFKTPNGTASITSCLISI